MLFGKEVSRGLFSSGFWVGVVVMHPSSLQSVFLWSHGHEHKKSFESWEGKLNSWKMSILALMLWLSHFAPQAISGGMHVKIVKTKLSKYKWCSGNQGTFKPEQLQNIWYQFAFPFNSLILGFTGRGTHFEVLPMIEIGRAAAFVEE